MSRSVMTHNFSQIPSAEIPRSKFNRSHGLKTTFDASGLVPIYCDEALPGDTFNMKMTAFARLATPINPIMDNLFMETFFFAVPNRLLWENWEKFNGAQDAPGDSTDYTVPTRTRSEGYLANSLGDYLGYPIGVEYLEHTVWWERAYSLVWNEWFRDENLQDPIEVPLTDGAGLINNTVLKRGKRHDYFTSCLPWPQKGDDPVSLPLGSLAPVIGLGKTDRNYSVNGISAFETDSGGVTRDYDNATNVTTDAFLFMEGTDNNQGNPSIYADLADATSSSINEIRQAFQIQKMYERDARGGTRYTEVVRSHFGVTSPDARLQRPEFLGGGSSMVNINPVPQTSETDNNGSPQGNLAAFGTATLQNHGFTRSFTEHCTLIGLVNVRADLTYQQGLDRMFSRQTRFDYYWPALATIGEQAVLNREIYTQASTAIEQNPENTEVFGYQERFAEYRFKQSRITGKFRSEFNQSLDAWHLSQDFAGLPALNDEFIEDDVPLDRVIATPDEPHFLFDAYFQLNCARPMPMYGIPGNVDRF